MVANPKTEKVQVVITSPDCMSDKFNPTGHDVHFFLRAMMNRMGVSYHKYGSFYTMFPEQKTGIANAFQRLAKYQQDGNLEWLVDAANYIMMEFMAPSHRLAHFRATDSDESPGSVMNDGRTDHGVDHDGERRLF